MNRVVVAISVIMVFTNMCSQDRYVNYLIDNNFSSMSYLENIFKEKDIVIFCEREHPECTQYDFFLSVIKSDWFIDNVGTVVCEVIKSNFNEKLDSLLKSENLTEAEVDSNLLSIYRNLSHNLLWTKTNFYYFIKSIYYLNQGLELNKKICIVGVDVSHDWALIEDYKDYKSFMGSDDLMHRDSVMADNLLKWYRDSQIVGRKSKALVIMNYRHAFMNKYWYEGQKYINPNFGVYIKSALPEKSTNVYLNAFAYTRIFNIPKKHAKGKWDKAFTTVNSIGIKFDGSPFGEDKFQLYPYVRTKICWKNVFDHMIYYNSIKEHQYSYGVNHLIDDDFLPEYKRRFEVCNVKYKNRYRESVNTEKKKKYKLFLK